MRNLIIAGAVVLALVGIAWVASRYRGAAWDYYQAKRWPAIEDKKSKLDADMDREIAARKFGEVVREYKRVESLIDKAEAKGHDLRRLRRKMPRAHRLIKKGEYKLAMTLLGSIALRVPHRKETVRVASGEENVVEVFPEPEGRPQSRRRRRKRR